MPGLSQHETTGAILGLALFLAAGCAGRAMPEPGPTLDAYEQALETHDVEALRSLMSERARQAYDDAQLEYFLERDGQQLKERAGSLTSERATVRGEAALYFEDGVHAGLAIEDGVFRVHGAGALPARPRSPRQALAALYRAVQREDLGLLTAILTPKSRTLFEDTLRELRNLLSDYDTAVIRREGQRAVAEFERGRRVTMRRLGQTWLVEEIE